MLNKNSQQNFASMLHPGKIPGSDEMMESMMKDFMPQGNQ
jgi:hypothetical protein